MERLRQPKRLAPDYRTIEVVDPVVATILRAKSGTQKMAMVAEAWLGAHRMIEQSERLRDPAATAEQLRERVARRMSNDAA